VESRKGEDNKMIKEPKRGKMRGRAEFKSKAEKM